MGPHWGPYRLGDGRGPEEAPGAGGHHEAGDVGHGERVRSRRVGSRCATKTKCRSTAASGPPGFDSEAAAI